MWCIPGDRILSVISSFTLSCCRAVYLKDISACKSCKQTDLSELLEFDLPKAMERELNKRMI